MNSTVSKSEIKSLIEDYKNSISLACNLDREFNSYPSAMARISRFKNTICKTNNLTEEHLTFVNLEYSKTLWDSGNHKLALDLLLGYSKYNESYGTFEVSNEEVYLDKSLGDLSKKASYENTKTRESKSLIKAQLFSTIVRPLTNFKPIFLFILTFLFTITL
ncbi:hypothetical protein AYI70_g11212 [Smittium culicis]|uniref:Uncharacterized protein n=1 Tax=Smittium culicis TaxID=133412 RepID=A0A1R1X2U9_9FUNG|nr:hypothetical protein AYI70_g11212 [Smittium culicis]